MSTTQANPALAQPLLREVTDRPRRYTLCVTFRCNLACDYCYVTKNPATMSLDTARRAVDFLFQYTPPDCDLEIGFFGGEPLLEFPLIQRVTELIERHPAYNPVRVGLTITTNGTIFSETIAAFFKAHAFKVCISCDGCPPVQNRFRHTSDGTATAPEVERTIRMALEALPTVLVNAVYRPETFRSLPESLDYLSGLGVRRIFLNADYTATWSRQDADALPAIYRAIADLYVDWYLRGDPHFVSVIDTKLAVLLRGGYQPCERCQMGIGELSITPDGGIYPCDRLIGSGIGSQHRIGSLATGLDLSPLAARCAPGGPVNPECADCGLKNSCMNWCSCSNSFMTGYYNRVGPFLCASERAAIETTLDVYMKLESQLGPVFLHHLAGASQLNSWPNQKGEV